MQHLNRCSRILSSSRLRLLVVDRLGSRFCDPSSKEVEFLPSNCYTSTRIVADRNQLRNTSICWYLAQQGLGNTIFLIHANCCTRKYCLCLSATPLLVE